MQLEEKHTHTHTHKKTKPNLGLCKILSLGFFYNRLLVWIKLKKNFKSLLNHATWEKKQKQKRELCGSYGFNLENFDNELLV